MKKNWRRWGRKSSISKNKCRKQGKILVEKETQEVLTLAGKCSDDNWLTIGSSSNPNSITKASKKKQKIFKDKHRESQSLRSSISRTQSTSSKQKLKILKSKPVVELTKKAKDSIRSTKVQMILERHRKQNHPQPKTFRESDTMDYSLSSKIQCMSSQERRSKNRSNMSEQMMNSHLVRLTVGGEEDSICKEAGSRRYTGEEVLSEASIEESFGILESKEENTESVDISSLNDTSKFKRAQGDEINLLDLEVKQQFYMNAPRQLEVAKFKDHSHLPPMSSRYENNQAISKNRPHQSNSSKLMEQLQKQNMKIVKTPKSKLIYKDTSKGPFSCKAKGSLILTSKWKTQSSSVGGGSTKSQTPGSALSKYSDKMKDLEENAVFLEDRGSSSKQFLTFTAPTSKRKEHKKNKSVGSKDNLNVSEAIVQSKVHMLNEKSNAEGTSRPLTDRNSWAVGHSSVIYSHQGQKMSKFTMIHNLNNVTNKIIKKQVNLKFYVSTKL